jgi:hypothetical protein
MDVTDLIEIALAVAAGVAVGIVTGGYVVLGMAESLIDDTLTAARSLAFELLANPTVAKGIAAAEKVTAALGKGTGAIGGLIENALRALGMKH